MTIIIIISDNSIEYLYNELTVLILACSNKNTEIVNMLLSKKDIDVNAMYKDYIDGKRKETALTFALKNNDDEIVKNLLANLNIDVNISYKYSSPRVISDILFLFLFLSLVSNKIWIAFGCLFVLIKLYQNKYMVIKILAIGILIGLILPKKVHDFIVSICEKLVKSEIISLSSFSQLLSFCEILGISFTIIELLSSLLCQCYEDKSPLQIAIEKNNFGNAKLLLENKNINVNFEYKTCNYSFSYNSIEELSTSKTALNMAAEIDNAEIVELLLSFKNIDVNARCKTSSHKRIIKLSKYLIFFYAIESFICLFFTSHSSKSTLEIATENKSKEILELLQKFMARNQLKQ